MIRIHALIPTLIFSFVFMFSACQHIAVIPSSPAISFKMDVQPIISSNCAMNGCHEGSDHELPPLTNYSEIMNQVVPANPDNSRLYESLVAAGENKMPRNGSLTDLQVHTIYVWIGQGAQNN